MASVLSEPEFQIFIHPKTKAKTGRIYFPALFLADYHESISQWLQRGEILFDERDLKNMKMAHFDYISGQVIRSYLNTFN